MKSSPRCRGPVGRFLGHTVGRRSSNAAGGTTGFFRMFPAVAGTIMATLKPGPFRLENPLGISTLSSIVDILVDGCGGVSSVSLGGEFTTLQISGSFSRRAQVGAASAGAMLTQVRGIRRRLLKWEPYAQANFDAPAVSSRASATSYRHSLAPCLQQDVLNSCR